MAGFVVGVASVAAGCGSGGSEAVVDSVENETTTTVATTEAVAETTEPEQETTVAQEAAPEGPTAEEEANFPSCEDVVAEAVRVTKEENILESDDYPEDVKVALSVGNHFGDLSLDDPSDISCSPSVDGANDAQREATVGNTKIFLAFDPALGWQLVAVE